ncbi:hypothetical protein O4H49_00660 [Kiloniella laminariae]|uniref:Uncharacterized protein n=1 Tax=Kiloniella laminariae TaxID=454162 RepID=A0ABT4LDU2_9PROT|nr:hypothetical protein [Kiloniella laminariae]MCZ4279265.1 hypothetical protein [Kiloniella laminariae]
MRRPGEKADRSIALFLLAVLLFSPLVLSIFSQETLFLGLPPLFAYLFAAWGAVILAVGWSSWREQADMSQDPLLSGGAIPGLGNLDGDKAPFDPENGLPSGVEPRETGYPEPDISLPSSQQTMSEEAKIGDKGGSLPKEQDLSKEAGAKDAG